MYVPPYVPQQIEIPGNVAEEKYLVRMNFVRRVAQLHFFTVFVAAGMAAAPIPVIKPGHAALLVLGLLIVLSIVRGVAKGRSAERRVSLALLPLTLFSVSLWFRALFDQGWPIWSLGVGVAIAVLYATLSGRDLSFVGMFVVSAVLSSGVILLTAWQLSHEPLVTSAAISLNAMFLFYYVYDLAALQTRRRLGEEWGAVVDLYRDILNGITYPIRVYHHWRKHNIWSGAKNLFR